MEVTLLPLLKQDINALDQLIEEVVRHWQIGDVQAWLGRGLAPLSIESSYRGCLEATLDRVYLLVHLFGHNGRGPAQKKTLGLGMRLLWTSLKQQTVDKATAGQKSGTSLLSSKASQTELTSLTNCDSCGSAISCVKRLLRALDPQPPARCAIFEVTQFGCMLKVTATIEQALNRLLSQLFEKQETNDELGAENQRLRARGALLEERVCALEAKLEAECRATLRARLEHERVAALIPALRADHAHALGRLQRAIQALPRPRPLLQLQLECEVVQSVTCLNAKLAKLHKNSSKLEMKLLGCAEGNREACAQLDRLQASWMALRERLKPKPQERRAIEGNPVEDIARAIEANKRQVEALQDENERLQRLLDRLRTSLNATPKLP